MIIDALDSSARLTSPPPRPADPLTAPRASGAKLIEPPLGAALRLAAANRERLLMSDYDFNGCSLAKLANRSREQLVTAALRYTRSFCDVPDPPRAPTALFLAGHQPELFHPGVWLKNFVLDRLARQSGGLAINLVIDSDTIKSSSLRVPGGAAEHPTAESILFDRPTAEIPFQARTIQDRAIFESFGCRAAERLAPLVPHPLLEEFWPTVVENSRRTSNIGECFAQSRRQWEGRFGLTTLELPQSAVCNLDSFYWVIAHLSSHLPRLWEVYNSALSDYRREHHIRSHAHPAPELAIDGCWLEAPFWIWTDADPRRRRVFICPRGDELRLSDREGLEILLPLTPECEGGAAVERLRELEGQGIHLRSRALLTTLVARLLLGDMFLHGIGGAKYDRLTDTIIERFFGIQPPQYMVVSGTLHLPIEHSTVAPVDLQNAERGLRELTFHPEQFLDNQNNDAGSDASNWIAEKQRRINQPVGPRQARERCRAIRRANEELQPWVARRRAEMNAQVDSLARKLRSEAILSSREYAFCLYPEKTLQKFLLEIPGEAL